MEKKNVENGDIQKTVERQANYEGSWSLLVCSRLENPTIKNQLLDILEEVHDGDFSRTDLERRLEETVGKIRHDTPISFENKMPCVPVGEEREIMPLGYINVRTGEKPTAKIWNILEAHEKGHVARRDMGLGYYDDEASGGKQKFYLSPRFNEAFDFSAIRFLPEEFSAYRSKHPDNKHVTDEEISDMWIEYYLSTPMELAERMSQLKNYFGFSGDEIFTKEHLAYAREHYITDTGYDNRMKEFFQSITPEKEEAFLKLINSAGI